jgi:Rod binding domain-containing protein
MTEMIGTIGAGATPAAGEKATEEKATGTARPEDPARVLETARQFESLLIAQLMKSIREDSGGWLGSGADQASEAAIGLAEEQFAQALSHQGGLGLASLVVSGLNRESGRIAPAVERANDGAGPPAAKKAQKLHP